MSNQCKITNNQKFFRIKKEEKEMKLLETLKTIDQREERTFRIEMFGAVIIIALLVGAVWFATKQYGIMPYVCILIALILVLTTCAWTKVLQNNVEKQDEEALKPIMDIVDEVLNGYSLAQHEEITSEYTLKEISSFKYCFERADFLGCFREYLVTSAENKNFKGLKKECSDEELKIGIAAILMTALFEFTLFEFSANKEKEDMFNLYIYEKILERFFKGESKTFVKDCKYIVVEAYFQLEEEQEQLDYMYLRFCDEYAKETAKKK